MSKLPEPFHVDLFKVDEPTEFQLYRYETDPVFRHRVKLVHRQLLEAWKKLSDLMSHEERHLFYRRMLWLAMQIVTNSTVVGVPL